MQQRFSSFIIVIILLIVSQTACRTNEEKTAEAKPEDNRFTKVVLATNLDEPMQFELLNDGRVLFVERKGKVKVYNPSTRQVTTIADFPVSVGYYSKTGEEVSPIGEDGMQGVVVDPKFEQNHWLYLFYTPKEGTTTILARFSWEGDSINRASKKILLEVPNHRESCCHLGGGMVFDANNNLYLSTGDNTNNGPSGFPNIDERPGEVNHDSQRSSSNTNDFRGKILRIHPEDNGSYTIPKENLFPVGTAKTLPEIYTMGNRNPYRLSIDSKTNYLYWGEVGPGGIVDSVGRGPKSYDEFNQARKAGNFGWPYAAGDNQAYWHYDFATHSPREKFDTAHPVNSSPNNTGLKELPPSQPALIWYPQIFSPEFPLLGTGSASAMGGPVYRMADFKKAVRPFPSYYEGKWFITDWTRGWIMVVTLDDNGNYKSMEQFMPELQIQGPNDMGFGPDGDLYVLQYGRGPYVINSEAQLFKIEYNKGNRVPVVKIAANKKAGAVPLQINFSSAGTRDYDNDLLRYKWEVISNGKVTQTFDKANPVVTFSDAGVYQVRLTVSDASDGKESQSMEIIAGNEPPLVTLDFQGNNTSFFFPDSMMRYSVNVSDKEDGSLADKKIDPSKIKFTIDFLSEGLNSFESTKAEDPATEGMPVQFATQLMQNSDCKSCHIKDKRAIGPSFLEVASKYKNDTSAMRYLSKKIRSGGSGVWGTMAMPPHTNISENDANKIVTYIIGLVKNDVNKTLPLKGQYKTTLPSGERSVTGNFIFRASYTDKGTAVSPPQTSVFTAVLRNQVVPVITLDTLKDVDVNPEIFKTRSSIIPKGPGSLFGLFKIDLTGIKQIEFAATALQIAKASSAGTIEIRIDSSTGEVIGHTAEIIPSKGQENFYKAPDSRVKAMIKEIRGIHDIYFLVSKSGVSDNKMRVRDIKFNQVATE